MRLLSLCPLLALFVTQLASADIINVPGDAPTLLAAFDMAVDGDEVVLADGVHSGTGNVNLNFGGRLITLRSASGDPLACTIDGGGTSRCIVFAGPEGPGAVVEGIRFVNAASFKGSGGAIRINTASPTITNCRFESCFTIFDGGAIQINGGSPTISDCWFSGCSSNSDGGAIVITNGAPTISGCVFDDNTGLANGGAIFHTGDGLLTLAGCHFEANAAPSGGAIHCDTSAIMITGGSFAGNSATGAFPLGGGAIRSVTSVLHLEECQFEADTAVEYGGSINVSDGGTCAVTGCDFVGSSGSRGGGLYAAFACIDITSCLFQDNIGTHGSGGVQSFLGDVTVSSSTFIGNESGFRGGGLVLFGAAGEPSSIEVTDSLFLGNEAASAGGGASAWGTDLCAFTNCVFSGNTAPLGGGLMSFGAEQVIDVTNCSFAGNVATDTGGAIHANTFGEFLVVSNSILRGNLPDEIEGNSGAVLFYSNIEGGWSGIGSNNDDIDPMLVDPDGVDGVSGTIDDDLRLQPGSPCIDAGDNEAVPVGTLADADGNARFVDDPGTPDTGNPDGVNPIVDMGAYELQAAACPTDTNGDGVTDVVDLVTVVLTWGTSAPSADVNGDGIVDVQDLVAVILAWGTCP